LNQDAARQLATACASCDLRHQLERAFGRAKIRHGQRTVCTDYTNQRHAMKIVPFRKHLRADQDIQSSIGEPTQHFLILALAARSIAIEPSNSSLWKFLA